jgi:hypothetical protein
MLFVNMVCLTVAITSQEITGHSRNAIYQILLKGYFIFVTSLEEVGSFMRKGIHPRMDKYLRGF